MEPAAACASVVGAFLARMDDVLTAEERLREGHAAVLAAVNTALAQAPPGPVAEALTNVAEALTWAGDALMKESESGPRVTADALAAVLRLAPLPPAQPVPSLSVVSGG